MISSSDLNYNFSDKLNISSDIQLRKSISLVCHRHLWYNLFQIHNSRRVQVLLVKNEKEHAWAINSRNID